MPELSCHARSAADFQVVRPVEHTCDRIVPALWAKPLSSKGKFGYRMAIQRPPARLHRANPGALRALHRHPDRALRRPAAAVAGAPPGRRRHDHQRRRRLRPGGACRARGGHPPRQTRPPEREDRLQGPGALPRHGAGPARGRPARGRTPPSSRPPTRRHRTTGHGTGRMCFRPCCRGPTTGCHARFSNRDGLTGQRVLRPRTPRPVCG